MAKMSFENHIMKQFDEELEEIRTRLMEMGGKVEEQLQNAILAISDANSQLAEQVILGDQSIDAMEVDIDEACILIIARRQPAASDLRLVMMVTKALTLPHPLVRIIVVESLYRAWSITQNHPYHRE